MSLSEPSGSVARFLAPLELARFRIFLRAVCAACGLAARAPLNTIYPRTASTHPPEPTSMTRTSIRWFHLCATLLVAGTVFCALDAVAQDKDKKVEKDKVEKDKKTDVKDKKDDKDKKEEKKKEEFKPDPAQAELKGHKGWIFALAFTEDGKGIISTSRDGTAKLWDIAGAKEQKSLKGSSDAMKALAYSNGVAYIADSTITKMKVKELIKGKDKEKDKEVEKDVKVRDYIIRIWHVKGGKEDAPLKGHTDWLEALAIDKEGKTLYSGGQDQAVKIWSPLGGKVENSIQAHTKSVMAVAVNKDGMIATAGADGSVKLWDKAGKEAAVFKIENTVKSVDPKTKKETVAKEPGREFTCIAFSPDGKKVAAGNIDGFIKIYDVDKKAEEKELKAHDGVRALAYSNDGSRLATGGFDGTVKIWETATGKELRTIKVQR